MYYEIVKCPECGGYIDPNDMYCYKCDIQVRRESGRSSKGEAKNTPKQAARGKNR